MDALNEHFSTLRPGFGTHLHPLQLRQVFACEIIEGKRKWIDALVNSPRRASGEPLMCIFCDIIDMGKTMAKCHTHGRLCRVPDCDILVASTSCKDLSKLSSNSSGFPEPVLSRAESPGGSAQTFRALLTYMDIHPIELLIYENSDNLDDHSPEDSQALVAASGQRSNSEIFTAEVTSRNMEGQSFVLNSSMFGTPQNRRRFWAVFAKSINSRRFDFRLRSLNDVFRTLRLLVQVCQRLPPSADSLLLNDSHPAVCSELARRTEKEREPAPFSWIKEHTKLLDSLLLPLDAPPPCDATLQSPWFKTLTRKQQSTLTIHQTTMLCSRMAASGQQRKKTVGGLINPTQEQRNARRQDAAAQMTIMDRLQARPPAASGQIVHASDLKFMIDLMPSPSRVSASTEDHRNVDVVLAPCIVPQQLLWLHRDGNSQQQRLMLGFEAMLLQGWPIGRAPDGIDFSNSFLQDLAGNATSTPVLLAVVLAMFYSVSWKYQDASENSDASDAEVDEALALFHRCQRPIPPHILNQAGIVVGKFRPIP
jgi:site-specific DNA-cytosine methylase